MPTDATDTPTEDESVEEDLTAALRDLISIERDRELGFRKQELHRDPVDAIRDGLDALESTGYDPDDLVWPDDQDKLGL